MVLNFNIACSIVNDTQNIDVFWNPGFDFNIRFKFVGRST